MPQRWIDNWRTVTAIALTESTAPTLAALVTGAPLAELEALLGVGDWCELTLFDEAAAVFEVLHVNADGDVERNWTGTGALAWPAGSKIGARLTAGAVERLQAATATGLSRSNLVAKLEGGYAGQASALFWCDPDLGAYARHDMGQSFAWVAGIDFAAISGIDLRDGYAHLVGTGVGAGLTRFAEVVNLETGTAATGSCELTVGPGPAGAYAPLHYFMLDTDPVAEIDARVVGRVPAAANATDDFVFEYGLSVPGIGRIRFLQARAVNSGNMTVVYRDASEAEITINTSFKLTTFDRAFCVNVVPAGVDHTVEISIRTAIDNDTGKIVVATLNASAMSSEAVQLGYSAKITKTAGTSSRSLRVVRFASKLTLIP